VKVHQGFGIEGTDVGILRVFRMQRPHCVGVGLVQDRSILRTRLFVSSGEGVNQVTFLLGDRITKRERFLDAFPRLGNRGWLHAEIDVRALHEGHALPRHHTLRIATGGFSE